MAVKYQWSVICPIHNEQECIEQLVKRIVMCLKPLSRDFEIILVDDGSTDNSLEIMMNCARRYNEIKVLKHNKRMGQAQALSSGFDSAGGDVIITMDADLQVYPEDIPKIAKRIEQGYDIVNAVRQHRKSAFVYRLYSGILAKILKSLFGIASTDFASNFMAVRKQFVSGLKLISNDHRYIIPIIVHRGGSRFAEVCVKHNERKFGKSKYNFLKGIKAIPEFMIFYLRLKKGFYSV